MKKYLTAAALFAAGTALANAATLTYVGGWDGFGASATTAEKLLETDSVGASSVTGTFTGSDTSLSVASASDAVALGGVNAAFGTVSASSANTNNGYLFVATFSNIENAQQTLLSINMGSNYGVNYVLTPGQNGLSDAKLSVWFGNSGDGTEYSIGTFDLDTSSGNVTIAFGFQRNENVRSFAYVDSLICDTVLNIGGAVNGITIGNSQIISGQSSGNFTMENFYAYSLSNSALTGAQVSDLVSAASARAIPEPSAFGLLAGAGALALAVSRRRRAKQARVF